MFLRQTLFDPETKAFVPLGGRRSEFAAQGIGKDKRWLPIAAAAFRHHRPVPAHRLGYDNLIFMTLDGRVGEGCVAADRDRLSRLQAKARSNAIGWRVIKAKADDLPVEQVVRRRSLKEFFPFSSNIDRTEYFGICCRVPNARDSVSNRPQSKR